MKKLVIVGSGGHGKVIADIASTTNNYSSIEFRDDRFSRKLKVLGHWVVGNSSITSKEISKSSIIIAVGDNYKRARLYSKLQERSCEFAKMIHPSANVSMHSQIGSGTVIMTGAVVNVDSKIGQNCIVNTSAVIEHDCIIGEHSHIAPGALITGGVTIGNGVLIGAGAIVLPNLTIGKGAIIGAGAVVIGDVEDESVLVGNPAKPIR